MYSRDLFMDPRFNGRTVSFHVCRMLRALQLSDRMVLTVYMCSHIQCYASFYQHVMLDFFCGDSLQVYIIPNHISEMNQESCLL